MPIVMRMLPSGVLEAGADPYGYREANAWQERRGV